MAPLERDVSAAVTKKKESGLQKSSSYRKSNKKRGLFGQRSLQEARLIALQRKEEGGIAAQGSEG